MKLFCLALCLSIIPLKSSQGISFTLRNDSLKSIPLKIPGVMNPNLSPMSNSGVTLKVGQEIFFFHRKKKHLLLEVSPDLAGKTIKVNVLIRDKIQAMKKE